MTGDVPIFRYAVRLTVNGKREVLPQVMAAGNDPAKVRADAIRELRRLARQLKREGFNVVKGAA